MVYVSPARIQRLLPGSVERVWPYLTDEDLRQQWLAEGRFEPRASATSAFARLRAEYKAVSPAET